MVNSIENCAEDIDVMVDMDDVVTRMEVEINRYVSRKLGLRKNYKDSQGTLLRSEDENIRSIATALVRRPDFLLRLRPMKTSLDGVKLLYEHNCKVHIVTARVLETKTTTEEWLEREGFTPFIEQIHQRPPGLEPLGYKFGKAQELEPCAIFEDDPRIAGYLAKQGNLVYMNRAASNGHSKREMNGLLVRTYSFYESAKLFCQKIDSYR